MASTGFTFAGTGADNSTGPFSGTGWTNPSNVTADDGSNATIAIPSTSTGLFGGTYGLSVPSGATIDGVEVRYRRFLSGGMGSASSIHHRLSVGGTATSDATHDNTTGWASSEEAITFGSSTDLWGEAGLTSTICNAAGFGFIIDVSTGGMFGQAEVDSMEINVYYTAAAAYDPANMDWDNADEAAERIAQDSAQITPMVPMDRYLLPFPTKRYFLMAA